jgi:hypothetical protein
LAHYTLEDLTGPQNDVAGVTAGSFAFPMGFLISNGVCNLGSVNPGYNSGAVNNARFGSTSGVFQMNFTGVTDLPYAIWASSDLQEWSQIGIASQPSAGSFQFSDAASTNYPARFYQVRLP